MDANVVAADSPILTSSDGSSALFPLVLEEYSLVWLNSEKGDCVSKLQFQCDSQEVFFVALGDIGSCGRKRCSDVRRSGVCAGSIALGERE